MSPPSELQVRVVIRRLEEIEAAKEFGDEHFKPALEDGRPADLCLVIDLDPAHVITNPKSDL